MCGIAALLTGRPASLLPQLAAVCAHMYTRGPDDGGYWVWSGQPGEVPLCLGADDTPADVYAASQAYSPRGSWGEAAGREGRVFLGHRRLSILDLSARGHQPMSYADGRYWISYNGEVYNYLELRRELERAGRSFVSATDTEVVLAAYAEWGPACVERFVGMWAFVLVDTHERHAFVARDPFGIKPLYHARWGAVLALASTPGSLRALGLGRTANPASVFDYLLRGASDRGTASFYQGIEQVLPAHHALVSLDDPRWPPPRRYWRPRIGSDGPRTLDEASAEVRRVLLASVKLHLRSDVRVGSSLSGGIDSSTVVGAMRHVGGPEVEIHAFNFAVDDPRIGEGRWAAMAGEFAGAKVHHLTPSATDLVDDLDRLILCQDGPTSISAYAQHRVFRLASEHGIRVMLDGQGADEVFAGYQPYRHGALAEWVRAGRLWPAIRLARMMVGLPFPHGGLRHLIKGSLRHSARAQILQDWRRGERAGRMPDWFVSGWAQEHGIDLASLMRVCHPSLKAWLAYDLENFLPNLLRFEDRNSMAHSVESRVPFLTTELVELVYSLPSDLLIGADGTTKRVLRAAARGLAPPAVLERRDKIGFEPPSSVWLRQLRLWAMRQLDSPVLDTLPALRVDVARAHARKVLASDQPLVADPELWRWLCLSRWAELNDITSWG